MRILIPAALLVALAFFTPLHDARATAGNYFHIDNFAGLYGGNFGGLVPIAGNQSLWCGVRAAQSGYPTDGYGNNWRECFLSCDFFIPPGDTLIVVNYDICYHTSAGHDSVFFECYDGAIWTPLKTYSGGPACLHESLLITAPQSGVVRFRYRTRTDSTGSDEDGFFDSDGAAIIDNISIVIGTQTVSTEDFECEPSGAQQTADGMWSVPLPYPGCADSIPCVSFLNPACDTLCGPLGLAPEHVSFEDLAVGALVEGLGTVNPYLDITSMTNPNFTSCNLGTERVIEEGNSFPYWSYKSGNNAFHGCVTGSHGMGDPNNCVLDYQFTFAPGYRTNCFAIRILDFGDYFIFGGNNHTVHLTAYDANNAQLDQDVLTFSGGVQTMPGDACNAGSGDPGNVVLSVAASAIARVTLTFDASPDPRVGFDDISFCGYPDSIPCVAAPTGLKGWWSGNWVMSDHSGYGNHGTGVGGVSYSIFPRVGISAFHFNGSNYVRVPDNPSLDFGTATSAGFGDFSFDAWVRLTDSLGVHPILTKFDSSGRGYGLMVINGKLALTLQTSQLGLTILDTSALTVPVNQWTFVAASVDRNPAGPTVRFYMNGQAGSVSAPSPYIASDINSAGDLLIGASNDPPTQFLAGELDEVEVYGKVIPQATFDAIYLADYAGKCGGGGVFHDCNGNGTDDKQDIADGTSHDYNGNDVPDECENIGCGDHNRETLDFGTVAIGDTAQATVTITNSCGGVFSGSVADTCTDFDVVSGAGPYSLAPGESLTVVVRFAPASVGTTTCTISTGYFPGIICTAAGDQTVPVALASYSVAWRRDHVAVEWRLYGATDGVDFEVFRKNGASAPFVRLNGATVEHQDGALRLRDATARPGKTYAYRVVAVENGRELTLFTAPITTPALELALFPNRPNPFNGSTSFGFSLDRGDRVRLSVYDIAGRLVRTLVNRRMSAGRYDATWDGRDGSGKRVASGVYFYRLQSGTRSVTRKAVLMR